VCGVVGPTPARSSRRRHSVPPPATSEAQYNMDMDFKDFFTNFIFLIFVVKFFKNGHYYGLVGKTNIISAVQLDIFSAIIFCFTKIYCFKC